MQHALFYWLRIEGKFKNEFCACQMKFGSEHSDIDHKYQQLCYAIVTAVNDNGVLLKNRKYPQQGNTFSRMPARAEKSKNGQ